MAMSILLKFLTLEWNISGTIGRIEVGDGSSFCIFQALSFELNVFRPEVPFKCSLTFKVGYLIKRGAYFETRRNFNIPLLIYLSKWLALFPDVINIQKRKQKRSYRHRTQKLKRLVGKTISSTRLSLQTLNSAISQSS